MTLPISAPPRPATTPQEKAPPGAVDTHIHVLSSSDEFQLWDKRIEDPAAGMDMESFLTAYRAQCDLLGIERTVVVHSILYGADNSVTLEAVRRLGDTARGICLIEDGAPETTLDALASAHVKGIRLNYVHGGVLTWEGAKTLAPALKDRGMHIQMLVHSHLHLEELAADIRACPVPVVLDHIAWPDLSFGVENKGFQALLSLISDGHAYVKLSGLYRVSSAPYTATDPFVAALVEANAERCLWGSDFPYIMLADAQMPDAGQLLDRFHEVVTSKTDRQTILVDAPAALYGF